MIDLLILKGDIMSLGIAFVEGKFTPLAEAKISIFDHGFMRGDAVFDAVSVWEGCFFRLDDHIARFARSCAELRMTCPVGNADITRLAAQCVQRASLTEALFYMICTRGQPTDPSIRDPRLCNNRFMCYALPYNWAAPKEKVQSGIAVAIPTTRRIPPECVDPRAKNFNRMDIARASLEAYDRGADCAILLTVDGYVSEGSGYNVFLAKDGVLATPQWNILEGITRQTVFDLAAELDIVTQTRIITPEELFNADEVFLSSTAGGIMPVTLVNDVVIGSGRPGPVTTEIGDLYWTKRAQGWLSTPVADLLQVVSKQGTT